MRDARLSNPWTYFAMVLAFTWACTFPIALTGSSLYESRFLMLIFALGGLGPAVIAIALVHITQDRESRREYWKRIIDFRRIPLRWYGLIFMAVPALTFLGALADRAFRGEGLRLEIAPELLEQPLRLLPFILFIFVFGPVPEELGWRGYALDRLQGRWNALASSLILGIVWAIWHLPLFFIKGTYQNGLGVATQSFWIFTLTLVVSSVFYTWIYNNSHRSTLSAILFHFMQNFTGELFQLSENANLYAFLLTTAAAFAIVMYWGPTSMKRGTDIDHLSVNAGRV